MSPKIGKTCVRLGVPTAFFFIALTSGCGPGRLLERPADMPAEVDGRRLWHTSRAYIYATHEATAGETNRWIGELAGHLNRTYKRPLGKGLVIVVDDNEAPFVDSIVELIRLQNRTAVAAGVEQHELPNEEIQRQKYKDAEMSEDLVCRITPFELDAKALAARGFPENLPPDVEWRLCCPSESLMKSAMWDFGPKAIEKKQGKTFAVATAWAWPLAFAEAAKGFELGRDVLAFELWSTRQADWESEFRRREIEKYAEQRALVLSPTLALAMKIAKGGDDPKPRLKTPDSKPPEDSDPKPHSSADRSDDGD
ncbi:MAG: hypothetical protein KF841_05010 [Phycisphaerae bacterium]|nr:hypothetical protein [Phycisphaerae bacterium]